MRIDLDARVETSDGHDAGTLQWAIVDPQTHDVTHFVISTDVLFGRAVEVPREHVENASRDGDVLRLDLSRDELEALPAHAPTNYATPPEGWEPTAAQSFPPGAYLWPSQVPAVAADAAVEGGVQGTRVATAGAAFPVTPETTDLAADSADTAVPAGMNDVVAPQGQQTQEIGIGKGAMVVDAGGEEVGVVDQLYFEEAGGELRGLAVRAGGMLQTLFGGGETVEVPARFVGEIGESTVYLTATLAELKAAETS